jgi:hypothetical protein
VRVSYAALHQFPEAGDYNVCEVKNGQETDNWAGRNPQRLEALLCLLSSFVKHGKSETTNRKG